jgi:putative ABC transport system permease protein
VSPGYFQAMGIPILRGRDFLPGETGGAIISEAMAALDFPDSDPLLGSIAMDGGRDPYLPIVGVVGSVRHMGLALPVKPEMYFPMAAPSTAGFECRHFVVGVRTAGAPQAMEGTLRNLIRSLDPDLPLGWVQPLAESVELDREDAQARSLLLGCFAALALGLSGLGIYAVIHFLTALRTREIGVRMALGARVADVVGLVLGQGLRMALAGTAAGLVLALILGRFLGTLITGVRFWDPSTLAAVVGVLVLVGAAACLLPALRAAKVDPMAALRSE